MDRLGALLTGAAALLTAITGLITAVIAGIVTLRRKTTDNEAIAEAIARAIAKHDEDVKKNHPTGPEGPS